MRRVNRWTANMVLSGCFLLAGSTASYAQSPEQRGELIPAAKRVEAADFTVADVYGKPITLSRYRGRVVLLDFWAISCGGCKLELPWYVDYDSKYKSSGLSLIGLDMYGESPELVKPFMKQWKMTYPVAIGTDALGERFGVKEMPLTLLIDRKGRIAVSHAGVVDKVAFESDIQKLLAE